MRPFFNYATVSGKGMWLHRCGTEGIPKFLEKQKGHFGGIELPIIGPQYRDDVAVRECMQ